MSPGASLVKGLERFWSVVLFFKKPFKSHVLTFSEELHVNNMQRYANAACSDGLDIDTLKTIASLANWGKHESNCERDLHRAIPFLYGSQFPTYDIAVEVFDPDQGVNKQVTVPVLLASTVLHEMHKKGDNRLWSMFIGATSEKAYHFWNAFHSDPLCSSWKHPVLESFGIILVFAKNMV